MRAGQVIAIPVLNRHIETSSGKCVAGQSVASNCVMADALRDRFPGAEDVGVGNSASDFIVGDLAIHLSHSEEMSRAISAFDHIVDEVRAGSIEAKAGLRTARGLIPRVVHATVSWMGSA